MALEEGNAIEEKGNSWPKLSVVIPIRNEERYIDLERKEYESLDITYNAICFPEVLHNHSGLVTRMERLYRTYVMRKSVASAVSRRRTKSP